MNRYLCCPEKHMMKGMECAGAFPDMANKIINVAGISSTARVLLIGNSNPSLEAAIKDSGARLMTADGRHGWRRWLPREPADVALFPMDLSQPNSSNDLLHAIRRHLRPGGRMVAWTHPSHASEANMGAAELQRMIGPPIFTSVILGQLPMEEGGAVVVTGIFTFP